MKKVTVFISFLLLAGTVLSASTIIQKGSIITDSINLTTLTVQEISGHFVKGILNMQNSRITNAADPINPQDAATKAYVDTMAVQLPPLKECPAGIEGKRGDQFLKGHIYDCKFEYIGPTSYYGNCSTKWVKIGSGNISSCISGGCSGSPPNCCRITVYGGDWSSSSSSIFSSGGQWGGGTANTAYDYFTRVEKYTHTGAWTGGISGNFTYERCIIK
jgi:hypothetical protein